MKWDRHLLKFGMITAIILAAAVILIALFTFLRVSDAEERMSERAGNGFDSLCLRLEDPENVSDVYRISKRGAYSGTSQYRDLDKSILGEIEYIGREFLVEEIDYTHELRFRLKVYAENGHESEYVKYTDSFTMYKNGEIYYVTYFEDGDEYRFIVKCDALTEWLLSAE